MSRDWTPRELYMVEQRDLKNGGLSIFESMRSTTVTFDGKTWPRYSEEEMAVREQLRDLSSPLTAKKAADFVRENPALAYEIFKLIDRENQRDNIVSRIDGHCDVDIDKFTDAEINSITSRFDKILSNNDSYWESYWLSADAAIYEVLQEKFKDGHSNASGAPWYSSIDELVETAVENIKGIGAWAGSGFYELQNFEIDGERMELVIEVCQLEDEEDHHGYYGVYYFAGYYDGDSLLADWEYTSGLDLAELKEVVSKLKYKDFTEDLKKAMGENSVEAMIGDAKERSVDSGAGENKAQEHVMD